MVKGRFSNTATISRRIKPLYVLVRAPAQRPLRAGIACNTTYLRYREIAGRVLDQHWIFDLAEQEPERLLSMSEEEFRSAMADAGFDVEELTAQFHLSVGELFSRLKDAEDR